MTKEYAIQILREMIPKFARCDTDVKRLTAINMAINSLAERKTGKWIVKDGWDGDEYYDCSACGESWTTIEGTPWDNDMNYYPHCGAKMEGAEE